MVEVAEDDGYPLTLFTKCVRDRDADFVERHEGCPCSGRVCRLDWLGGESISTWHKNDGVSALRSAANSEVVREGAIRNPPVHSRINKASYPIPTVKAYVLLRARDDPLITIFVGISLHAADIAPSERLTNRQTYELLASKDVRDDLGLEFRRTKVEDGRQTDYVASKKTIHVSSCATACKLRVNDELGKGNQATWKATRQESASSPPRESGQTPLV